MVCALMYHKMKFEKSPKEPLRFAFVIFSFCWECYSLPSESKTDVTCFKDIKIMHARDLKQIAKIGHMVFYLGYSFEKYSTL